MMNINIDGTRFFPIGFEYEGVHIPTFLPRDMHLTVPNAAILGIELAAPMIQEVVVITDEESINRINSRIEHGEIARISIARARALNYSEVEIMLNNPHLIV